MIAKNFTSRETATRKAIFQLTSRVTGGQASVHRTANPLVALFSAPSCEAGRSMRATFAASGGSPNYTDWQPCHPPLSMNFYVAGMLASTAYSIGYQVLAGRTIIDGPTALSFTTGALPSRIAFPSFELVVPPGPQTDTSDSTLLHGLTVSNGNNFFIPVATDLYGDITWYYGSGNDPVLTRPLPGGFMLTLQNGVAWNPALDFRQYVREIDLAGNIVRETNTGIVSQQLLALGATDATPCNQVPNPPPVGAACLNFFNHEAMRLPNGYTAILARLEKLFVPGTQGSTTGQPVDIMGDMAIVLDTQWQVVWYFDEYQQLDTNRAATLGETCANVNGGPGPCLMTLVLASAANDWTHTNSIYYIRSSGDLLISVRNQDWLLKVYYNNGRGLGGVLWRMGIGGDFTFNNINNDPFPWFSHQHDAEYQSNGALTVFDNSNTRFAPPPIGLGHAGYSRGMALRVDETNMQVTPILSVTLGTYSPALGSAGLLHNGNYFFQPGQPTSYDMQILPSPGTTTGTQVFNLMSQAYSYRAWQMRSLYQPPTN